MILFFGISLTACHQNKKTQQDKPGQQKVVTRPWSEHKQLPIWSTFIPDSGLIKGTETYNDEMVKNVSIPTITVYPAQGKNTGVAALVFPGGGYNALAIELSGTEVCEWLTSIGITGILVKYRVPGSGPHWDKDCDCHKEAKKPMALEDAQRAIGLVRLRAREWNIDPQKIGVIGFSAGGHLVAQVSTLYTKRAYPVMDEADKISCRPDFGMVIYPGHLTEHTTGAYELNPAIPVNGNTPQPFWYRQEMTRLILSRIHWYIILL